MGVLLKVTFIGVLLASVGERLGKFCHRFNYSREIDNIDLPNCHLVKGIDYGSEDIEVLPNGLAFISSGLKYPGIMSFAPERPAEILLLDMNNDDLQPISLPISKGFDMSTFNPHGLSSYIDEKDNSVYLFVVNHPHHKTTIEIFKFIKKENVLEHLKTIKHPELHSVNDIVAVGPESFYVTNDHYFTDDFMKQVELLFGSKLTNVVYYSPEEVREVATDFYSANGIAMSKDKKFIYVSDLTGHTVNVLEKHGNWSLSPVKVVQLETLPDNLFVDPVTGDVWTGGHPNAYKLFFYNKDDPPGTEVVRIQNIHSDNPIVTTVYANKGSVLQGSSCAVLYGKKLLVGTVFHKVLYCPFQ
ncbi:serum paraoxonase/arylesterase 2-like [Bufo gargarizans]|uniref:serum paraoxonase/arylesterase 2-like n=1 Tax=Bufo gargarizans TaxID=30331 RepID=UPI001CF2B96D|nr:serum paraoxonase/arylesterase 2-like [Bufo gargarizans]